MNATTGVTDCEWVLTHPLVCKRVDMRERSYRLELEGELTDGKAHGFSAITLTYEHGNTVLVGRLRDQSELDGLLRRVSESGLILVSFHTIETGTPT